MDEKDFSEKLFSKFFGQPKGTFSLLNLFMTTDYPHYDFHFVEEAIHQFGIERAAEIIKSKFKIVEIKEEFVYEYTVPSHERRHFYDLIGTPFGWNLFLYSWQLSTLFLMSLQSIGKKSRKISIPIRDWVARGQAPLSMVKFLEFYEQIFKNTYHKLSFGSPFEFPSSAYPKQFDIILLRVENNNDLLPYAAFLKQDRYYAYPLNASAILEALAWNTQLFYIALFSPEIGERWYEKLANDERLWVYYAANKVARACAKNFSDSFKILEFALMTPLLFASLEDLNKYDPDENDPGCRFYALAYFLMQNKSENLNLDRAIENVCKNQGWKLPIEVIKMGEKYLELRLSATKPKDEDPLLTVLDEFKNYFLRIINIRKAYPLMGLEEYVEFVKNIVDVLPPIHRKSYPDGHVELRGSDESGIAWSDFVAINSLIVQIAEGSQVVCPFAYGSPAVLPGNTSCSCEWGLSKCLMSGVIDRLNVTLCHQT